MEKSHHSKCGRGIQSNTANLGAPAVPTADFVEAEKKSLGAVVPEWFIHVVGTDRRVAMSQVNGAMSRCRHAFHSGLACKAVPHS